MIPASTPNMNRPTQWLAAWQVNCLSYCISLCIGIESVSECCVGTPKTYGAVRSKLTWHASSSIIIRLKRKPGSGHQKRTPERSSKCSRARGAAPCVKPGWFASWLFRVKRKAGSCWLARLRAGCFTRWLDGSLLPANEQNNVGFYCKIEPSIRGTNLRLL